MMKSLMLLCVFMLSAYSMNIGLKELEQRVLADILKEVKVEQVKTNDKGILQGPNHENLFKDAVIDHGISNLEDEVYVENDGNVCTGDRCIWSSILRNGGSIYSRNKWVRLWMQDDGNLVLYCDKPGVGKPIWHTNTWGKKVKDGLYIQDDGNLVLYDIYNRAIWASGTHHTQAMELIVQNDGNLVLYDSNFKAVWSSGTWGKC